MASAGIEAAGAAPGCTADEVLAEPRRRVGGTGQPMQEVSATVPRYAFSLPVDWLTPSLARHLARRAVDPNDPPTF